MASFFDRFKTVSFLRSLHGSEETPSHLGESTVSVPPLRERGEAGADGLLLVREDGPGDGVTPEAGGRYAPLAPLGRGGMGVVGLVGDSHLHRRVALKELHSNRADLEERFLREARVTAQLEHPGIVPIYELGRRADGTLYYTMRRVRGQTLGEALAARTTLQDRLGLLGHFVDLCQAVGYAHSRGVVHRDLKPENVMIGPFGETLVLDWGLSKVGADDEPSGGAAVSTEIGGGSGLTEHGAIIGTPMYMSPEQAAGNADRLDARSDVWSLGVILYEVIAGRAPFLGDTQRVLQLVRWGNVTPLRELEPKAPPALCAIAHRALAKAPRDRYASAAILAREMEAWRNDKVVAAHRYSATERLGRFLRRYRISVAVVAALVLSATLFVPGLLYQRGRVLDAEETAQRATYRSQALLKSQSTMTEAGLRAAAERAEANSELPDALALRRAELALASTPEERAELEAHITRLAVAGSARVFGFLDRPVEDVRWALDGALLIAVSDRELVAWWTHSAEQVFALPVGGRSLRISPDRRTFLLYGAGFASVRSLGRGDELHRIDADIVAASYAFDGRRAALADQGAERLSVVDTHTGEMLVSVDTPVGSVTWSPDGRYIATGADHGGSRLWNAALPADDRVRIWRAENLREVRSLAAGSPVGVLAYDPDGRRLAVGRRGLVSSTYGTVSRHAGVGIWDVEAGRRLSNLDTSNVDELAFVGEELLLAGPQLWRTPDGDRVGGGVALRGPRLGRVDESRSLLAVPSDPAAVDLLHLETLEVIETFPGNGSEVWAFDLSEAGLAVGSVDGGVRVWGLSGIATVDHEGAGDVEDSPAPVERTLSRSGRLAATVSPTGDRLEVSRVSDGTLVAGLDLPRRSRPARFTPVSIPGAASVAPLPADGDSAARAELHLAFSSDDGCLLVVVPRADPEATIHNLPSGTSVALRSESRVLDAAFVGGCDRVVTVSDQGTVLWDDAGAQIASWPEAMADEVVVSATGLTMAGVQRDTDRAWVLDPGGGDAVRYRSTTLPILSADGSVVVTRPEPSAIRVSDRTGEILVEITLPRAVDRLALAPDNSTIAGISDRRVFAWDVSTGVTRLRTARRRLPHRATLSFVRDPELALVLSSDDGVRLRWPMGPMAQSVAWVAERSNLHVCRQTLDVVPVLPPLVAATPWAPDAACAR